MKIISVCDFKNKATSYLKAEEPVLVTRYGKVAGLFLPLQNPESFPVELRRELLEHLGEHLSKLLATKEISEEEILEDFQEYRKTRR